MSVDVLSTSQPARRNLLTAGQAARELDAEVTRLLRVRRGELAEPLAWTRAAHRRRVELVLAQLEPIRSHHALTSSWAREARQAADVRLAYALRWLAIDRQAAAARARRRPRLLGSRAGRGRS